MQTDAVMQDLQAHTILSALNPAQLARLLPHARALQIAAGEVLFQQGQEADAFYIVRTGSVQIGVPAINGPGVAVQTLGAHDVLGWSWLIPPYKWTFEARSLTRTTLLRFDGKAILQECERDPALGYALMKLFAALMSARLQAARLRMMECWAPPGWA
ncbi:MAG: cyclic nucleotide-binding domain-containing protein [Thiomonas sp.]|nr:cyclic nucleotide-binding domain-containing protein [Thiomonas sp.]